MKPQGCEPSRHLQKEVTPHLLGEVAARKKTFRGKGFKSQHWGQNCKMKQKITANSCFCYAITVSLFFDVSVWNYFSIRKISKLETSISPTKLLAWEEQPVGFGRISPFWRSVSPGKIKFYSKI